LFPENGGRESKKYPLENTDAKKSEEAHHRILSVHRLVYSVCRPHARVGAKAGEKYQSQRIQQGRSGKHAPGIRTVQRKGVCLCGDGYSFTRDGIPVLLHDAKINRTARNQDGSRLKKGISINSITYEDALSYDFGIWKGPEYKGTKIPTFEEFLQLCKALGLYPYIELKKNGDYTREQIVQLVKMVQEKGMEEQVTWISFSDRFLAWVRDYDPHARLGFLEQFLFSVDDFEKAVIIAKNLQTEFNEVFLDVSYIPLLYDDCARDIFISMCREAGLGLEIWTVDREDVILDLDPYISGITTNKLVYEDVIKNADR